MGVQSGGSIFVNGEEIPVGSARFAEVMPIASSMLMEMQADDDIANVVTALTTAVMKLETELQGLRNLGDDPDPS
jgi:hypothetical protein